MSNNKQVMFVGDLHSKLNLVLLQLPRYLSDPLDQPEIVQDPLLYKNQIQELKD